MFLLIAFGWTWILWWVLFLSGWVSVPEELGTQAMSADLANNLAIVFLVALSPFGPRSLTRSSKALRKPVGASP